MPLREGDSRDQPEELCVEVVNGLPRCVELIRPAEVIRRVAWYFEGGALAYLTAHQFRAAKRGVRASLANGSDDAPLTLHNARIVCERFIQQIDPYPERFKGRGMVICGGGFKYFTNAWVCINMLRRLDCSLPIQLWHLGEAEVDASMRALLAPFNVECVDALTVAPQSPLRRLGGWELKPYAIVPCPFREVLYLDADSVPVVNPQYLFETPQYQKTGAVFWPDFGQFEKPQVIWDSGRLARPAGPEFESGPMRLDKRRCWAALQLCLWFNQHSDCYYQHLHRDKETFHRAFRKLQKPFALVGVPSHRLEGTMCQHDFEGRRIFQHRNTDKGDLLLRNKAVKDFRFEDERLQFIHQLRRLWDGRMSVFRPVNKLRRPPARRPRLSLTACMISCPEREAVRRQTLANLAATD